jgi:metal-sulfur cluster biosynthetic enzyme
MDTAASNAERQNEVYRQLRRVVDPELGMSIVQLGLLYDIQIDGDDVTVVMTLTTRGCPLERAMVDGVRLVTRELPWVRAVDVQLVWDPPWDAGMIRSPSGNTREVR